MPPFADVLQWEHLRAGKHVLTVGSSEDVVSFMRCAEKLETSSILENCEKLLKNHSPKNVGRVYMEELKR